MSENTALSNFARDILRRSFLKSALVGTAGSLLMGADRAEAAFSLPGKRQKTNETSGWPSDDLTKLSLREASGLVHRKHVSPVELTNACLARIERLNPVLNAFITVTAESALTEARAAESALRSRKWRGPLHGIPIALKDLIDTAGIRTTAGSAVFKDRVPTEDAEVVRRLKTAGAVILGKLNMHEFASGATSIVSYFGAVHNPWDLGHIAGGSSGGSAAAIAADLCFGALGSDTGGSIVQPAAYCGIVGLKPTYGLVSTRGVIPLSWSLDHVGPMTRTVADAALLLQAIAGFDPDDISSRQLTVPNYASALSKNVASIRIGVPRDPFFHGLHPEIEKATADALSVMRRLTANVMDVTLPVASGSTIASIIGAEQYAYHADLVAKTPELYQLQTLRRVNSGKEVSTSAYIQGLRELAHLRLAIRNVFDSVDVLITPTAPMPPATIADAEAAIGSDQDLDTVRNAFPFDMYGLPTVSVPCGFTNTGLPIGFQICGPPGGEAIVLRLALVYEQATDWHKRRPSLTTAWS